RVLPLVRLRRLQQMLAHGLAVEVEFIGNGRHTPSLLLQIAYVHKILQVEHWAPWSAQRFHTWGFFRPALLGNFQPALLGNFRPALTVSTPPLGRVLREWHEHIPLAHAMDATGSRFHGDP